MALTRGLSLVGERGGDVGIAAKGVERRGRGEVDRWPWGPILL